MSNKKNTKKSAIRITGKLLIKFFLVFCLERAQAPQIANTETNPIPEVLANIPREIKRAFFVFGLWVNKQDPRPIVQYCEYCAGSKKNAELVYEAFLNSSVNLSKIEIFHTDRGNEFKNKMINEVLSAFEIKRSLSKKGSPYDNAVAESFFKTLKKELVRKTIFHTRAEARDKIFEYIEMFYNSKRRHSFLDFISPNEFEKRYNDSVTQSKVLTE